MSVSPAPLLSVAGTRLGAGAALESMIRVSCSIFKSLERVAKTGSHCSTRSRRGENGLLPAPLQRALKVVQHLKFFVRACDALAIILQCRDGEDSPGEVTGYFQSHRNAITHRDKSLTGGRAVERQHAIQLVFGKLLRVHLSKYALKRGHGGLHNVLLRLSVRLDLGRLGVRRREIQTHSDGIEFDRQH